MTDFMGPYERWLGLVDAGGVAIALLAWYAVRGASDRIRAVATAAGGLLLAFLLAMAAKRGLTIAFGLSAAGFHEETGRHVLDVVLSVGGLGAAVVAVLYARAARPVPDALALATADLDTEPSVEPEPDAPSERAWVDAAAVALGLALPVFSETVGPQFELGRGGVGAAAVFLHLVTGVVVAGALFAVLRPDGATDPLVLLGAFAVVAAGFAVLWAWPSEISNEYWTAGATWFAIGLLFMSAPRFLARVFPLDPGVLTAGALAALLLLTLQAVANGRVLAGVFGGIGGQLDDNGGFVVPAVPEPTFPTFPPFPTFPVP